MGDLNAAYAIIALLSLGLFFVTLWATQRAAHWMCDVVAGVTICGLLYYTFYVWDEPVLARIVPVSSLVVLGNWYPLFASLLAGAVWNRVPGKAARKALFVGALGLAAFYSAVRPLQGVPPLCENRWAETICLQTSQATCSPACAATLLGMYGIDATEGEMADLCLTRKGTHWKGLYRALKFKTSDSLWDVEFFRCSYDELRQMQSNPTPMILTVEYNLDMKNLLSDGAKHRWSPGISHSIVLVSFESDGTVSVADPWVGAQLWTERDFRLLWQGEGMRLVDRIPSDKRFPKLAVASLQLSNASTWTDVSQGSSKLGLTGGVFLRSLGLAANMETNTHSERKRWRTK
ncbi:MAG: C39 family peptidase [Planctomycetaceae bacterium]